jgi:pyrroline-5-carboxylate reductase
MTVSNMSRCSAQIGFIGAGRMATALAQGLIRSGFVMAEQISAGDVEPAARAAFERETGATTATDNAEVAARAAVIILAIKPQSLAGVLTELRPLLKPTQLVVSIVDGATIRTLTNALGEQARIVRVMPNTPCLVGRGASAFALGKTATQDDAAFTQSLLTTVGLAVQVPESQLDAVTGLSGSGPAYAFQVIEALSDGGVCAGLPRNIATQLAAQTLLGAAEMVLTTGQHPGALKDAVASPGGTTIAGLHELERGGLRAALMNAVVSATRRSQELGRS